MARNKMIPGLIMKSILNSIVILALLNPVSVKYHLNIWSFSSWSRNSGSSLSTPKCSPFHSYPINLIQLKVIFRWKTSYFQRLHQKMLSFWLWVREHGKSLYQWCPNCKEYVRFTNELSFLSNHDCIYRLKLP